MKTLFFVAAAVLLASAAAQAGVSAPGQATPADREVRNRAGTT